MKIDWKAVAPLALGGAILLSPVPAGLSVQAWQFFALFVTVIAALILEPIPAAAIGLMGVTLAAALIMVPGDTRYPGHHGRRPALRTRPASPTAPCG